MQSTTKPGPWSVILIVTFGTAGCVSAERPAATPVPTTTAPAAAVSPSEPRDPVDPEWDERVAPLAEFVEGARDLDFEHAVPVEYLDDAAFRRELEADDADVSDDPAEEASEDEAAIRAMGLIGPDFDAREAADTLVAEGVLAFYDPAEERIVVRKGPLGDDEQLTIVHELTHALDDQHFDLDRDFESGSAEFAFAALVEGDAVTIEDEFAAWYELDRDSVSTTGTGGAHGPGDLVERTVPSAMRAYMDARYTYGSLLVLALRSAGGNGQVDAAFRSPPTSELQVLDPRAYLEHRKPRSVRPPALARGARALDEPEEFGPLAWLLVLGERLDTTTAIDATIAWGGDVAVPYERDGERCVRVAVEGSDAASTSVLRAAITRWDEQMPPHGVNVVDDNGTILVDACDRGDDALPLTGDGWNAYVAGAMRAHWLAGLRHESAPDEFVSCASAAFVRVAEAVGIDFELASDEQVARFERALVRACT